jgi:hypothetical protein
MIPFDTDSSFCVCDNSATRHLYNDKSLFSGELVPAIYIVGAAMGTSKPTLMGTVFLCTTKDNGKKAYIHSDPVNYMPKSPVKILSTWALSKQNVGENGLDNKGTGVFSGYDDHILYWDYG